MQKLTFPKPKKMWFFLVYVYIACEAQTLQNDKSMHACDLTGINTSYQELDNYKPFKYKMQLIYNLRL